MIGGQYLTPGLTHRNEGAGLGTYKRAYPPFLAGSSQVADRYTIVVPPMEIDIVGRGFYSPNEVSLNLSQEASWDTITPTDYRVPINRAGVPFFIFACYPATGSVPKFLISASSTTPSGYTTANSRRIGGFDCLPYVTAPTWSVGTVMTIGYVVQPSTPNATNRYIYRCTARSGDYKTHGTTEPVWPTTPGETIVDNNVTWTCDANGCEGLDASHPYKNFRMGDIIFNSINDIIDGPRSSLKRGMVKGSLTPWDGVPAKWCDIYLMSGTGSTATSVFGATIQDTKDWMTFVEYGFSQQKWVLDDDEFQKFAYGGNEQTNIAGSADPGVVTFPLDTTGKSMISYYGCIGMAGVMYQWLRTQSYRFDSDGSYSAAAQTATITYVASLEGVPVYLSLAGAYPELCANIAADLWITMGSYKVKIKAVVDPVAIGATQVYFRDAATLPLRLYSANATLQTVYIPSRDPSFVLPVVYHATPATQGTQLNYDNVTHNRLESVNAGGVNATIDLAYSPGFSWYSLPGSRGQLYKQGANGDVKLLAGGSWSAGSYCGSRCRYADAFRWRAHSAIGSRLLAEPL
jgi:hypothetical protein